MIPFATITPSRGNDRPKFLNFVRYQLERMTVKPSRSYFIDYDPKSNQPDLVSRVRIGCQQAYKDGYKWAFIVENDDFYEPRYFEKMAPDPKYHIVGSESTVYYNVVTSRWQEIQHRNRASLFHTGINLEWLFNAPRHGYVWPKDDEVFLDLSLWRQAKKKKFVPCSAIGIKGHGQGLIKSKGHSAKLKNQDPYQRWLKSKLGDEYEMLINCL